MKACVRGCFWFFLSKCKYKYNDLMNMLIKYVIELFFRTRKYIYELSIFAITWDFDIEYELCMYEINITDFASVILRIVSKLYVAKYRILKIYNDYHIRDFPIWRKIFFPDNNMIIGYRTMVLRLDNRGSLKRLNFRPHKVFWNLGQF